MPETCGKAKALPSKLKSPPHTSQEYVKSIIITETMVSNTIFLLEWLLVLFRASPNTSTGVFLATQQTSWGNRFRFKTSQQTKKNFTLCFQYHVVSLLIKICAMQRSRKEQPGAGKVASVLTYANKTLTVAVSFSADGTERRSKDAYR